MRRRIPFLACTVALLAVRVVSAQSEVVVRATRIADPMRVDGQLDEAIYRGVAPITEFLQQEPDNGAPITEKTEVWVLFDDKTLYLACRCWHEDPDQIVASDMRRDSSTFGSQDHLGVVLDTFYDRRTGLYFSLSPLGAMRDGTATELSPGFDWNAVWEARAARFEGGWIGEMAIPFKSLRYAPGREQVWGIQIRRTMQGKNEQSYITHVPLAWGNSAIHHMSAAATLVGLEVPPAALNLEVKPYGISRVTTDLIGTPALRDDLDADAGVDVKYGLTKGLTADFTYNTDFAQVEADEVQVNLTRFNLVFPEKREFFLEGQNIFTFGTSGGRGSNPEAPAIFYSRRIGLNAGRAVPVLGGGRLTGKAGPWSVGALSIQTDRDEGSPQTNFTVVRLRRDVLRKSTIGGILTRRSVSSTAPGDNLVWGLDANVSIYANVTFTGYVAQSRLDSQSGDNLSYDTFFNYIGDRYGLAIDRLVVEKNFNPEVGFMRRTDFRRHYVQGRFSPRTSNNPVVRRWIYQGHAETFHDGNRRLESRQLTGQWLAELHNSDLMSITASRLYEFLPEPFVVSRGVRIPVGGYDFGEILLAYTAGQQRRVSGTPSFEIGSFYGGNRKTAGFRGRVAVTMQLGIEPNISVNWIDLPQGRFTNTIAGGRTTFTVTPRMFVAALVQYSSSTTSLLTNVRYRWEYQPGSELFVVYTEGRSTLPPYGTDLESRGFVVKINRLFRF